MMKSVEYYTNGMKICGKKFIKKMTLYDLRAMGVTCAVTGMLFASCLPRVTKKIRGMLALTSFFLMIPVLIKTIKIMKDVFKYRWD